MTEPVDVLDGKRDVDAVDEAETAMDEESDGARPSHRVTLLGLVPMRSRGFRVVHVAAEGTPPVEAYTFVTASLVGTSAAATVTGTRFAPLNRHVAIKEGDPLGPLFKNVHQVEEAWSQAGSAANA